MPTLTPKKGLPKGNGPDNARDYLKGAIAGGGLWTALDILDNTILDTIADAKGDLFVGTAADTIGRLAVGPNGTFLVADSAQPTGLGWSSSLTLTGPIDMQSDATIHDTLYFGAKPNGAADTNLKRNASGGLTLTAPANQAALTTAAAGGNTGLRVNSHQGNVFGTQADIVLSRQVATGDDQWMWFQGAASAGDMVIGRHANSDALTVALWNGSTLNDRVTIAPYDTTTFYRVASSGPVLSLIGTGDAIIGLNDATHSARIGFVSPGTMVFYTDSAQAGLQIGTAGNLAYISAAGQAHQWYVGGVNIGQFLTGTVAATSLRIYSPANIELSPAGGTISPSSDAAANLGAPAQRFGTVYAATGTINTSSAAAKTAILPLDPAEGLAAFRRTEFYGFDYNDPVFTEPEPPPDIAYDEHDDNDTKAEKKAKRDALLAQARDAHNQMLADTAPHRKGRKGIVLGSADHPVDPYFHLDDGQSVEPVHFATGIAVALKGFMAEVDARLSALESR